MSVYKNDELEFVKQNFASIINQTVPPNDLSLLIDGAISDKLLNGIYEFKKCFDRNDIEFNIIKLKYNRGRGIARNLAIENTKTNIVALTDADDLSDYKRVEKQLKVLSNNIDIDLVSTLGYEGFFEIPNKYIGRKILKSCPENNEDISKILSLTCPIINPSILFKKNVWEKVNGFPDLKNASEDYMFFLKLRHHGFKFYCLQEPLVYIRMNNNMLRRRIGFKPLFDDLKFRLMAFNNGYCGFFITIFSILIAIFRRIVPIKIFYFITLIGRKIAYFYTKL